MTSFLSKTKDVLSSIASWSPVLTTGVSTLAAGALSYASLSYLPPAVSSYSTSNPIYTTAACSLAAGSLITGAYSYLTRPEPHNTVMVIAGPKTITYLEVDSDLSPATTKTSEAKWLKLWKSAESTVIAARDQHLYPESTTPLLDYEDFEGSIQDAFPGRLVLGECYKDERDAEALRKDPRGTFRLGLVPI